MISQLWFDISATNHERNYAVNVPFKHVPNFHTKSITCLLKSTGQIQQKVFNYLCDTIITMAITKRPRIKIIETHIPKIATIKNQFSDWVLIGTYHYANSAIYEVRNISVRKSLILEKIDQRTDQHSILRIWVPNFDVYDLGPSGTFYIMDGESMIAIF
jgi:hypothetical protein